jgi:peptide/nickel transport system permease protein
LRAYLIRRILLLIPTLILVTFLVFLALRLIPGDVIDLMVREAIRFTPSERAMLEQRLGLDVPVVVAYARWLGIIPQPGGGFAGILQGNLGNSLWSGVPVHQEILGRVPITIELGILALLTSTIIALPIGIYSAIRQDTFGDYIGRGFATLLIALPNFWAGLMVILIGSLWLGMSPGLTVTPFMEDPIGNLKQFIVPAFVLGMAATGSNMRLTRSMMLEVLRQDYIRTAWAKGLKERVIISRHAIKNALIPVITLYGIYVRTMLGGTVIIEIVFNLPGTGRLLVDSVNLRDYTMVPGVILFFAIVMVGVNLIVDICYGYLDPRIRYN